MLSGILTDPLLVLYFIIAFLVGLTVHEFMHAWTANFLGDPTAKNLGRVSLNPLRHLDVFGVILFLLASIGWGKPVPVNPARLRFGKYGDVLVSVAGAVANLLVATAFGISFVLLAGVPSTNTAFIEILRFLLVVVDVNVMLAVFNLIPIPPLDGSKVIIIFMPQELTRRWLDFADRSGFFILFAIILVERFTGLHLFSGVIDFFLGLAHKLLGLS